MLDERLSDLKPMTDGIEPITVEERQQRVENARRLMVENGIDAIYLDGGSSLRYFTAVEWWRDERMMGAIIPARGEIAYVVPGFEEARLREMVVLGDDVRPWQEHESPYKLVAQILRDRAIVSGRIGMEESVRFFLYDGIRQEASHLDFVSADPVTIPCRALKSQAEIALMQRAMIGRPGVKISPPATLPLRL